LGSACLTPSTIDSVEVAPFLSTVISTERRPSTWTTLVCCELPSWTKATSRIEIVAPLTTLTGRSFNAAIESGALLSRTEYCVGPILTNPAGLIWFCAAIAAATLRSTCTCRWRPPEG
jgi:hypothetical protein